MIIISKVLLNIVKQQLYCIKKNKSVGDLVKNIYTIKTIIAKNDNIELKILHTVNVKNNVVVLTSEKLVLLV